MFYSVETNSLLSEESGHSNRVNDLSLLNNNLYSASDDKHIIQWDLSTHKIKRYRILYATLKGVSIKQWKIQEGFQVSTLLQL